jgi:DNA-binding NarL/FixJ family response regulator
VTSPHVGVLVVTMFEDDDSVFAAMRAGRVDYLLKGARKAERCGLSAPSPAVRRSSAPSSRAADGLLHRRPARARRLPELTDRER